ncbi:uncharacterized protein LOC119109367 [Pollicipes pollicipes]|uniref:uncharacterized protein LOC119109367 n=1 Tax=Pollicipes pollicipes TaxID=41117 RepID=UPI0018854706|nr:uncharacterized protein LOC119109367 [Pollicipes pollicipes]
MSGKRKPSSSSSKSEEDELGRGARTKTQPKKKKNALTADQPPELKDEPAAGSARPRLRREPLPMKLRALPQSFWLQPNANQTSPNTGSLPPLVTTSKDAQDINDVQPITPPDQRSQRRSPEQTRSLTVGNPDLLFSLFDNVSPTGEKKRLAVLKRNRTRKGSGLTGETAHEDDPYMCSSATESILPLLPDRSSGSGTPANKGTQILSVVQIPGNTDRETICLPSLSVEHNYANILSQLVMKL